MGTRGVVGFKYNDRYKVTYNHFDSYPKGGLGEEVVRFCDMVSEQVEGWDILKRNVLKLKMVQSNSKPTSQNIERYKGYSDLSVSDRSYDDWYCLMRNLQNGVILHEIYVGNVAHMIDSFDFLNDGLFCEYGYIINLDDMTLDFYKGMDVATYDKESSYQKVLIFQLPFDKLPHQWLSE